MNRHVLIPTCARLCSRFTLGGSKPDLPSKTAKAIAEQTHFVFYIQKMGWDGLHRNHPPPRHTLQI